MRRRIIIYNQDQNKCKKPKRNFVKLNKNVWKTKREEYEDIEEDFSKMGNTRSKSPNK